MTVVLRSSIGDGLRMADLDADFDEPVDGGIVCLVGAGLCSDAGLRQQAVDAMASLGSSVMAVGGSANTVISVVEEGRLADAVNRIHQRFFGAET